MKNLLYVLFLALLCAQANTVTAQAKPAKPTQYSVYAYMKVAPGMEDDYIKMEKAYKKIHAARKKAGLMDDWSLSKVMSPYGTNCEYNYVARNGLVGDDQLAAYFDDDGPTLDLKTILTKEEMDLVSRTDEIRSLVKQEVWSSIESSFADDWKTSKIAIWNFFDAPAGKTLDDHTKVEKEIWKPIHDARIKDGKMMGWVLMGMNMPFGASMPYNSATIDVYKDMKQYLAPWTDDYFKKVHPGKDMNKLFAQTTAATTLVKGEVRMIIDRLDWK